MKDKAQKSQANQLTLDYSPRKKTSFLQELAGYVKNHSEDMGNMAIVFPNRRAGLYFLRILADEVHEPSWGPEIFTLEEYYGKYSDLTIADRYSLIFRLYRVYSSVYESPESLDSFFFWGEMLLKDFDEIDRFLVDPDPMFSTLKEYKSIESLDYLDDDQKEIIRKFWLTVEKSKSPESWVSFWSKLIQVYKQFKAVLREDGIGYSGMLLRDALENVKKHSVSDKIIFAGFNALTTAEEAFITHFIQHHEAEILWDVDEFYLQAPHEAGKFIRKYQQNEQLNKWLGKISKEHLNDQKNIKVIGSGTWIGQVKVVGQILEEISHLSGFE